PLLVVVRLRPDPGGSAVDLLGGLAGLLLADLAKPPRLPAELLLPRPGVGERDGVARPPVDLRHAGAGPSAPPVAASGRAHPPPARPPYPRPVCVPAGTPHKPPFRSVGVGPRPHPPPLSPAPPACLAQLAQQTAPPPCSTPWPTPLQPQYAQAGASAWMAH